MSNTIDTFSAEGVTGLDAYIRKVVDLSPIAYWPLSEPSGVVANDLMGLGNGAYSNVTLGQTGIGDGRTSALFNGTTSYCNIYSAALASAFNGAAGTISIWAKVSGAGAWADGIHRVMLRLLADGNNYIDLAKSSAVNTLLVRYNSGAVLESVTPTSFSPTTFFQVALTWNKAADEMKVFVNGIQSGITQTGLGIWAGAPASTTSNIGSSSTTPAAVWAGYIAHPAIWTRALTPAEVATLAVV